MAQTAVDLPDQLGGSKTDTGEAFKSADDPDARIQRATAEAILQKPAEQPPSAAEALANEMEEDERAHAAAVARMKQPAASPDPGVPAPAKPATTQARPDPAAAVAALEA